MIRKLLLSIVTALATGLSALAQTVWYNPIECGAQVHGQGWPELNQSYNRLPDHAKGVISDGIWNLSRQSAGLSIVFVSDADTIRVRYKVKGGYAMYHMPSTGVSGVDLFALGPDNNLRWCYPHSPARYGDGEINYRYEGLVYHPDGNTSYEYHLYLPLYNSVEKLEIGVNEGASLTFVPVGSIKPIVAYGTSIAQGACASRPGNAWTNILERELRIPFVNLGFSGSGKMEPEMFHLLSEIDAGMYIIDCIPNMGGIPEQICERLTKGVEILRKSHNCPILLVEHTGCGSDVTDQIAETRRRADLELEKCYRQLKDSGVENIHLMTREDISMPMNGMVEGSHPNDYGMRVLADAYEKAFRMIPASADCGQDYEPGRYAERSFSISKYLNGDSTDVTLNSRQKKNYSALWKATTMNVVHKNGNNFEITLSCSLDSTRYKGPLTLKIDGVTMWMRASQGGKRLEAKGGKGHWTVDVNPFGGPVSVVAPRYFPPVDTGIEPAFTVKLYTTGQTPGSAGAGDCKLGAIATPAAETCLVAGADPGESNGTTGPEYRRENGDLYNVGDDARFDVYLPSNPNGQMVVICPGGGYAYSATLNEGKYMAKMFVDRGIAAAVLHYRMPNGHYTVPLTDIQNTFRWCRAHASEWGVRQIGVLGGSAGGHLAASASTMFTDDVTRPDFSILFYPVITMDDRYTNGWTKKNLLGDKKTDAALCDKWSLENAVTERTPRTFIVQCEDDTAVPMENALRYYGALRANKVQAEIHIYPHGGHGWGCNKGEYIGYGRDPFEYARPEFEASLFRWLEEMAKDMKLP